MKDKATFQNKVKVLNKLFVCKYIDDYHLYIGNCCYHICEFAEKMELSGSKVEPINQSEPSKNKTRNREKQR